MFVDRFLEPRDDLRYRSQVCFGIVAVHVVAELDLDHLFELYINAAILHPTDVHVDFTVVDFPEFFF